MLSSPITSKGSNIFLSYGNLLDVLRQVSITGLIATGMTGVILTAGIDLSVGSLMAICSVVCAMLLTMPGWTPSAVMGLPAFALVAVIVAGALVRFASSNLARGAAGEASTGHAVLRSKRRLVLPTLAGLLAAAAALAFTLPQVETGFGVWGVLLVTPCVGLLFGAINGIIIVAGRLQPFIVTLAMMVTALGIARLTAGQNNAVLPVYTGSNATADFDVLRSLVFGIFRCRACSSLPPRFSMVRCFASRRSVAMSTRSAATRRRRASRASTSVASRSSPTPFPACLPE
jgi:simple sugar transport system permease protein